MKRSLPAGVTLLELALVMALLVIVAAVVAPRFASSFPSLRMGKTVDEFVARAQMARADAALTGARYRMTFDVGARSYWIEVETRPLREPGVFVPVGDAKVEKTLPDDITFESWEGLEEDPIDSSLLILEFRPDGTATEATLVLVNQREDRRTIRVDGITSRVWVEAQEETGFVEEVEVP